jgi:uncharacterized protein (DUF3084 family)
MLLLVLSGAVAYIGDLLGRRFGKKKVSLFGLRPKYTSIIITIVSGVMITAITLGAMLLASQYVRTALFGLEQLRSERAQAQTELAEIRGKMKQVLERNRRSKADLDALQKKFDTEQAALGDLRAQLAQDSAHLDELSREIDSRNKELESARQSLQKVEGTLAQADKDVARLTAERARLEQERAGLMSRKETLEREIAAMAMQLSEAQKDILHGEILFYKHQSLARYFVSAHIDRADLESNLNDSISVLEESAAQSGAVVGPDAKMFRELQIGKVWDAVLGSEEDLVIEARSATNVIKGESFYIELTPHQNRVLFSQGEAVSGGIVPAGTSEEQVREILSGVLSGVMEEARRRGILLDPKTGMVGTMSVVRFQDALADLIMAGHDKKVTLFAVQDTRVADKLHVDYRIE